VPITDPPKRPVGSRPKSGYPQRAPKRKVAPKTTPATSQIGPWRSGLRFSSQREESKGARANDAVLKARKEARQNKRSLKRRASREAGSQVGLAIRNIATTPRVRKFESEKVHTFGRAVAGIERSTPLKRSEAREYVREVVRQVPQRELVRHPRRYFPGYKTPRTTKLDVDLKKGQVFSDTRPAEQRSARKLSADVRKSARPSKFPQAGQISATEALELEKTRSDRQVTAIADSVVRDVKAAKPYTIPLGKGSKAQKRVQTVLEVASIAVPVTKLALIPKGVKAAKAVAAAGGTKAVAKAAGKKTVVSVKSYPARKARRVKTYPKRKVAQAKAAPGRIKASPATAKRAAKTPLKTTGRIAKRALRHPIKATGLGYAGASPVIAASGTVPDAPLELAKAQASEAVNHPGRYIRRSGAFVPGAATGAVSLALNLGAAPFTKGESAKRAFEELVASNKEFAGYLSSDPKKQKKLAEEYGLGPAVIAALPLAARRSRKPKTELKKAVDAKGKPVEVVEVPASKKIAKGPIGRRRQRLRMTRNVTHASNEGQSKIARAQKRLHKKSTYSKLDDQHKRAAIFLTDARVATENVAQAKKDLGQIASRGEKTPGTDPHTASWLLERIEKDPSYLKTSGIDAGRTEYAGQVGRLDPRLMDERAQQVRREAPHMQEKGFETPSQSKQKQVKIAGKEVGETYVAAKAARVQQGRRLGVPPAEADRLRRALAKAEEAQKPVSPQAQDAFLEQAAAIRKTEGRDDPSYSKQTPLTALEQAELRDMAPSGRGFQSVGTRLRKRTGKTQEKGTRAIDIATAEHADIVAPRHRNTLLKLTDALSQERHVLTKAEVEAIGDAGTKFRPNQNRGSLTPQQARAALDAGVFDSKNWTFMPESKRLREEALQRPGELAGKLAEPGANLNAWLDTAEATWGKGTTLQAIPRTLADEWVSQTIRGSEVLGKIARTSGRIQSAALLAHSLFWIPAQIIIEGGTAAAQVGVHRWPGLVKDIWKMTDEQKAKLDADAGQAAALGQLDDWGKRRQSTTDFVKEGEKLQKGFLRSHWHRPVTELFTGAIKIDRAKGRQFRRIVQFGKAAKATDSVRKAAGLSKNIPRAKKYEWLEKHHPKVLKEVSDNTMDMMGDWSSVTRSGKLGGERAFATGGLFYGMVRYTTHFIFSAFPRQHPIVAPVVYAIGIQNTKRLEELLGGDPDYLAQLMQALVYTKGANKPPRPADISRIVPGGNPALELGLSAKARPSSALKLAQPILSTVGLPALGLDPQSGRPIVPPGATVTSSGKILQKAGTVEGLTSRQTVKAILGSTLGLSSGVRLAEQLTGRTGRGIGPGGELNLPFTKAPNFDEKFPSSAFYKAVLPTSGERLRKGLAPPLATLPLWKQRALREYQEAKVKKDFLGNIDVQDGQIIPDELIGKVNKKQLTRGQAQRAYRDGVKAMERMAIMQRAAKAGTLQRLMEK